MTNIAPLRGHRRWPGEALGECLFTCSSFSYLYQDATMIVLVTVTVQYSDSSSPVT